VSVPGLRVRPQLPAIARGLGYGVLSAWAVLIALRQADRLNGLISKFDGTGLEIPNCRFFGPNPGSLDRHLLFREKRPDGTTSSWREVSVGGRRRPHDLIWGPQRRLEKAVIDLCAYLLLAFSSPFVVGRPEIVELTMGYLGLLAIVTNCVEHDPEAIQVQFAVGQSAEYEPSLVPTFDYVSRFHDLPARQA
jgi:hypothetical protein